MRKLARGLLRSQGGATAMEYGLILALISVVVIAAASGVFQAIAEKFNVIANVR